MNNLYFENSLIKLYCGDCLEIMPDFKNDNIIFDACITDPPYGTTNCKWDSIIPFDEMWNKLLPIMKDNASILLHGSQPFSSALVMSNIQMFKHEWIWIKNRGSNFANTVREPMKEHEQILFFSNGNWTYNKQMQERTESGKLRSKYKCDFISNTDNYRKFEARKDNILTELRVPSSYQKFNTETGLHPTQKPVALLEYLVKTYTNEGDLILDFCAGSGTTGIACMNLNRRCILIEKEEKYCEIIANRLNNHIVQGELF